MANPKTMFGPWLPWAGHWVVVVVWVTWKMFAIQCNHCISISIFPNCAHSPLTAARDVQLCSVLDAFAALWNCISKLAWLQYSRYRVRLFIVYTNVRLSWKLKRWTNSSVGASLWYLNCSPIRKEIRLRLGDWWLVMLELFENNEFVVKLNLESQHPIITL